MSLTRSLIPQQHRPILDQLLVRLSLRQGQPAKRGPKIGEHNEEVLRQLGFSATEIDGLRENGAIPKAKEHAA